MPDNENQDSVTVEQLPESKNALPLVGLNQSSSFFNNPILQQQNEQYAKLNPFRQNQATTFTTTSEGSVYKEDENFKPVPYEGITYKTTDQVIEGRKKYSSLGLWDLCFLLEKENKDPLYNINNLKKSFFPEYANGSEEQNRIILYYLLQKGWQPTDPVPYVTHTYFGTQLAILSTFEGQTDNRSHATIAAFAYINYHGLLTRKFADEVTEGFYLYESEAYFNEMSNIYADRIAGKNRFVPYAFSRKEPKEVTYNKSTKLYSKELLEKLYQISGDKKLHSASSSSGKVDYAFTQFVKSAQEVLFYDDTSQWTGMLTPDTQVAIKKWFIKTKGSPSEMAYERVFARYVVKVHEQSEESPLELNNAVVDSMDDNVYVDPKIQHIQNKQKDLDSDPVLQEVVEKYSLGQISMDDFSSDPIKRIEIQHAFKKRIEGRVEQEKETLVSSVIRQQTSATSIENKLTFDKRQMLFREQAAQRFGFLAGEETTVVSKDIEKGRTMYQAYKNTLLLYSLALKNEKLLQLEKLKSELIVFYTTLHDLYIHDSTIRNSSIHYGYFSDGGVVGREIAEAKTLDQLEGRLNTALEYLDVYFGLKFKDGDFDDPTKQFAIQNLKRQTAAHQTEYDINKDLAPNTSITLVHAQFQPQDNSLESVDLHSKGLPSIATIPVDIYYYKTKENKFEFRILIEGKLDDPFLVRDGKDFDDLLNKLNEKGEFMDGTLHGTKPDGSPLNFPTEGTMQLSDITGNLALGLFIAGVVLLPFTAGGSSALMLMSTAIGGVSSAAKLKELYDSGRLTPATATPEVLSAATSLLPVFKGIRGLTKLSGMKFVNGRTFVAVNNVVNAADATVQGFILTDSVISQFEAIDNDKTMSEDEKKKLKREIFLTAMAIGSLIIVSGAPEKAGIDAPNTKIKQDVPGTKQDISLIKQDVPPVKQNASNLETIEKMDLPKEAEAYPIVPDELPPLQTLNKERQQQILKYVNKTPETKAKYEQLKKTYTETEIQQALHKTNGNLDNAEAMLAKKQQITDYPKSINDLSPETHPWYYENGILKTPETHPYLYNGNGTPKAKKTLFNKEGEFIEDTIKRREAEIDREAQAIEAELAVLKKKTYGSGNLFVIIPGPTPLTTLTNTLGVYMVRKLFTMVEKYKDMKKELNLSHEISILDFEKEMVRSGRFNQESFNDLRSAIIHVFDDSNMKGLTPEEMQMAIEYRTRFKNTQYTNYELVEMKRNGYVINENGRLVQVTSKTPDLEVLGYVENSKLIKKKVDLTDEEKNALDELRKQREAVDIKIEQKEKSFKDPKNPTQKELDEVNQIAYEKVKTSEKLGELASDIYMRKLGYEPIYTGSGRGTVDKVYKNKRGHLVVVEAKGGSSTLGSRIVKSSKVTGFGSRAQQGTKPYLQDVAYEMIERGGEDEKIGRMILDGIEDSNLEYLTIRQGFEADGSLAPIQTKHFDISDKGFKKKKK